MQNRTGYVYDDIFLEHTQAGHPENAKRLEAIINTLDKSEILPSLTKIDIEPASIERLRYNHSSSYIQQVSESGAGYLDLDTYFTNKSYEAAVKAAGGLIELSLSVLDGTVKNGFALVRPPGHHALPHGAMGFCIFNNVAVAAKVLQIEKNLDRIAIIDIDVHHGNGTQDSFYDDPNILFISTHQYPYYPGTGSISETGRNDGKGTTINIPLTVGTSDNEFQELYDQIIIPALERFDPQFIFVSAGYDAHWDDPLAGLSLSLEGYNSISRKLIETAEAICDGKIVLT